MRPALLAAIVLLPAFLGCLDAGDAPAQAAVNESASLGLPDAGGFVPVANASDAGNHLPHVHDYWSGRDRVVLLDTDVEPDFDDVVFRTAVNSWFRKEARAGGAFVTLPDNTTVFEGTGQLLLTASWSDPRVSSLEVSYRTGSGREFTAFQPLENGKETTIDVTPAMTDMPHMRVSRWGFIFEPASSPLGSALGPFHVKVEIVRVRDVMAFPAHPDHFEGADEKIIHDAPGESAQVSYAKRVPNIVTQGEFTEHWITPQEIVPMATRSMLAEVLVTKADANVGSVGEIRFFWTTAGNTNLQRAQPVDGSIEEKRYLFEFPVNPEDPDSPYATESQWQFLVEAATNNPGPAGQATCGGCFDTDIEFQLVLTARRAETDVEPMDAS